MLFQSENVLESEKERNFYSKIFAGFYFNELIEGYEERLQKFCELLKENSDMTFGDPLSNQFELSPDSAHVTFDFHGYLVDDKNDRGELADILISDIENKSAAAIEVKFLSNWNFGKDIKASSHRLRSLLASDRVSSLVHVLLISESKLNGVRKAAKRQGSNWNKLCNVAKLGYPIVLLTWEDIAERCTGPGSERVGAFIRSHIGKSRGEFRTAARALLGLGPKCLLSEKQSSNEATR